MGSHCQGCTIFNYRKVFISLKFSTPTKKKQALNTVHSQYQNKTSMTADQFHITGLILVL